MSSRRGHGGFTLVEILIALAIGLFLTAGIVQIFIANKQTYRFNEALARIQETGRFALDTMARDLRMAGFFACAEGTSTNNINTGSTNYDAELHDFSLGLEGRDEPSGTAGDPDEITMRGALGAGLVVQGGGLANPITVPGAPSGVETTICGYSGCISNSVADLVLVSNCTNTDIFQVTSLTANGSNKTDVDFAANAPGGTPGNSSTALSAAYSQSASLYPLRVVTYEVQGSLGDRRLFQEENGVSRELLAGVENMEILYGVEQPSGSIRFLSASPTLDWDAVRDVRISLLLSSTEGEGGLTSDSPQSFTINGATHSCETGHICQLVTATVTLRNRVP